MNAAPLALPLALPPRGAPTVPFSLSPSNFAIPCPLCRMISLSGSPSPPSATLSLLNPAALSCERLSPFDVLPPPPLSLLLLLLLLLFHRRAPSSSSSSSSHSYSCSGNSLPPARRRTLLHFLRAFSPPRGSDASNTPPPSCSLPLPLVPLSFSFLIRLLLVLPLLAAPRRSRLSNANPRFTTVSSE